MKMKNDLVFHLRIISGLTQRDLKARYASSSLGTLWVFVNPILMMWVIWMITRSGLKGLNIGTDLSWLFVGYITWIFFSEVVLGTTNSIIEYSFLLKRVRFPVILLPIIKIFSSLFIHLAFIFLLLILSLFLGKYPTLKWFVIIYYMFSLVVFVIAIGWIFSSINVFVRDIAQIIGFLLQIGFWLTPVIWHPSSMSSEAQKYMQMNPIYYIIEGYRNCLSEHSVSPWYQNSVITIYFWSLTLILLFIGYYLFNKLKRYFSDVI